MTEYLVPYESAESEFEEKRSRFISHVFLVESEAEARARIDEMKKKYYDARHNCWCFVLHDGTVRYGDDGEPQGTAGQPMLNVFQRENVENVVCIVTRYFGGILLGAGGLTRAYAKAAKDALDKAGKAQKLGSVPEAQNDMIFSIICEELGIVGGVILLLLFGYLLYRLCFIAQNAPDLFGSLIVSGIFIHIALQVILNIAVVVNLMPNTGVTLPFISYGGTSIMFLMAEMGLALSVSRQIKLKTPERAA